MCGRFFLDNETISRVMEMTGKKGWPGENISTGDVSPSQKALVISGKGMNLTPEMMRWGFKSYRSSQLLINARAETALQKPAFCDSLQRRRCVIPARHYYE